MQEAAGPFAATAVLEETRATEMEHGREGENLVRRYKAEIDMLSEALRIAATDVGAVVDDIEGSEDGTCSG